MLQCIAATGRYDLKLGQIVAVVGIVPRAAAVEYVAYAAALLDAEAVRVGTIAAFVDVLIRIYVRDRGVAAASADGA